MGVVVAITPSGDVTVRAPGAKFAPEGTIVADRLGRRVGRVVRVFGPVGRPYLAVRPPNVLKAEDALGLVGSELRWMGEERRGRQ